MKLVEQWYKAWSVWLLAACTILSMPGVYEQIIAVFPDWQRYVLPVILLARVVQQGAPKA